MPNPLIDKEFLKKLDEFPLREIYIRIISLTADEQPIDEIQGRATAGSINLDGDSAVRRTCSLTLIADNIELRDYYWGLKNKFKLEVGMKNFVDSKYSDIIWFPQGTYVITSFNTSQSATGYTVNISGKDKMALLNGEISGKIHANSTRFDIVEELTYDGATGAIKDRREIKIPIKEIIQEIVHEYGNEPLHNIVINDIDDYGLELLEYKGKDPIFLYKDYLTDTPRNIELDKEKQVFSLDGRGNTLNRGNWIFDNLTANGLASTIPSTIFYSDNQYNKNNLVKIAKITSGQTVGYRLTELTYPGELIAAQGETVTGVLDKIKTMFNDFEYFYDINGRFIFQRKPIYINQSWNTLKKDAIKNEYGKYETYAESMTTVSPIVYQFQNNALITSITNTPNYTNLKNDFSLWGKRTSLSGVEIPIHLRYAIQHRPKIYKKISNNAAQEKDLITKGDIFISSFTTIAERTELLKDLVTETTSLIPSVTEPGKYYSTTGISSKIWVVDWRELIYQMALDYRRMNHDSDYEFQLYKANPWLKIYQGKYEQYYIDMEGFWRQVYKMKLGPTGMQPLFSVNAAINQTIEHGYFVDEVTNNPEMLLFWIDFLDTEGDMGKYGVDVIGDRAQIVNDDNIKGLWFKDTPLVIYYDNSEEKSINRSKTGYTYMSLSGINELFSISSQGKSAKDELDNQLQNYTLCTESVSINALPIYYLQPNTRIRIKDDQNNNVNGEYIISKITLPLTHNGTMSIAAVKDAQTIL